MSSTNENLFEYVLKNKKLSLHNKEILGKAQSNKVLYYLSTKNKSLSPIKEEGDEWLRKLSATVNSINSILKEIPFVITRTYKYIPYVTVDVDLYVDSKKFNKVIQLFENRGFTIESHDSSLGGRISMQQMNIRKSGLLTIDLHRDFTWQKRKFLDTNLLFKNTRTVKINDIQCIIPSPEVELLLCMSDIGHERFNITFLDIIWLQGLKREIKNWKLITDQTNKYGWNRTFLSISKIVNKLSKMTYNETIFNGVGISDREQRFPTMIPLYICFLSYLENIIHNKKFPIVSFLYMIYCKMRYYYSGKRIMPYYSDWYEIG